MRTRRIATTPSTPPVPAPEVMPGMEYLDLPDPRDAEELLPRVAVQGIGPQPSLPLVPRVALVVAEGTPRPDSVEELLDGVPAGRARVHRLTFDVRPLRDVLEARLGWNGLAQLVDAPSDTAANAGFRAALADVPQGAGATPLLEDGDLDADVCLVDGDDTAVVGGRHELGRARLALTGLLAGSGTLTRRLAETLGRPRDSAGRRCLEETFARLVADAPLDALLLRLRGAPHCAVPGTWPSESVR